MHKETAADCFCDESIRYSGGEQWTGGGPHTLQLNTCPVGVARLVRRSYGQLVELLPAQRSTGQKPDLRDERKEVTLDSRKLQRTYESIRVNPRTRRYSRRHVHARIKEATLQSLGKLLSCRGILLLTQSKGILSFSTVCPRVFEWTQRGLTFKGHFKPMLIVESCFCVLHLFYLRRLFFIASLRHGVYIL